MKSLTFAASCIVAYSQTLSNIDLRVFPPNKATRVVIAVDSSSLAAPQIVAASPPSTLSPLALSFARRTAGNLTIHALGYSGAGFFPVVRTAGEVVVREGANEPVSLQMAWPRPDPLIVEYSPDGTTSLSFSIGAPTVFRRGDVLELWISPIPPVMNCSGIHLIAPLLFSMGKWKATFVSPGHVVPNAFLQIAYHALAFSDYGYTPLLVWPNIMASELPLAVQVLQPHN